MTFVKGCPQHNTGRTWFKKGHVHTKKMREASRERMIERNKHDNPTKRTEVRDKLRFAQLGKKSSEKTRLKMSLSQRGERGSNWQGGKSYQTYPLEFNAWLRTQIRQRDRFTCICGLNGFDVHHIDFNKQNNNPRNLKTLCRKCHMKITRNKTILEAV